MLAFYVCCLFCRSLKNDLLHLSDGVDNLGEWRLKESLALGKLVQNRIEYLQVCTTGLKDYCMLTFM